MAGAALAAVGMPFARVVDALADRTGIGEAIAGALLVGASCSGSPAPEPMGAPACDRDVRDGQLMLEDGNHRVESLRRSRVGRAWTLIGFEEGAEPEARDT